MPYAFTPPAEPNNSFLSQAQTNGYIVDYYGVLGISRNATHDEVRDAYRKLAKLYHPDLYERAAPEFKALAGNRFNAIAEAYAVLSDENLRCTFDIAINSWRGAVSSDGSVVIDLNRPNWSALSLLKGAQSLLESKSWVMEQAEQISGYRPGLHTFLEEAIKAGNASPQLHEAYDDSLAAKQMCEELKSSFLKGLLGLDVTCKAPTSDKLLPVLRAELEPMRGLIQMQVAGALMNVRAGQFLLKGQTGSKISSELQGTDDAGAIELVSKLSERALMTFDELAVKVEESTLALEKTMKERLSRLRFAELTCASARTLNLIVILKIDRGEGGAVTEALNYPITLEDGLVEYAPKAVPDELSSIKQLTASSLELAQARGFTVVRLSFDNSLPLEESIEAAIKNYVRQHFPDPSEGDPSKSSLADVTAKKSLSDGAGGDAPKMAA